MVSGENAELYSFITEHYFTVDRILKQQKAEREAAREALRGQAESEMLVSQPPLPPAQPPEPHSQTNDFVWQPSQPAMNAADATPDSKSSFGSGMMKSLRKVIQNHPSPTQISR